MLPKFPVYKPDWFLLGLVFAFLILLISPVSATNYYPDYNPNGEAIYNGEVFDSTVTVGASDSVCAAAFSGYDTPQDGSYIIMYYTSGAYTSGILKTAGTTQSVVYSANKDWVSVYGCRSTDGQYTWRYIPIRWVKLMSGSRPAPSIGITASPSSGSPVFSSNISITGLTSFDTVQNFNITAPNLSVYSLSSPTAMVSIDSEGSWVVRAQASNTGGTSIAQINILGSAIVPPVSSFSCTPLNTTSPALISCTDSSTHLPTSWLWQLTSSGVSISPDGSYGNGIFSSVNLTQNPEFYMSGSGMVDVRLTATNEYGSDEEYKSDYIIISGIAPTPTPTPNIPWPNQTGVCWHSGITLGSGQVRDYIVHYQLTNPQGDTYSGQYQAGVQNYITNQPFFTALEGQYVYQELALVTGELLWRQSYIVEDCTVTPTVTQTIITGVPTPSVTYTIPATYPTITIPTGRYTVPVTPVPYDTASPPPTIPVYPTIDFGAGSQDLYNYTITVSPLSKPVVDFLKRWLDSTLKTAIGSMLAVLISPFMYILSAIPQSLTAFTSGMLTFVQFPILFLYAIGTIVRNMPEKVMIVFSIFLWWNIILYLWGYVRRVGR